jgi:hypothetical protein
LSIGIRRALSLEIECGLDRMPGGREAQTVGACLVAEVPYDPRDLAWPVRETVVGTTISIVPRKTSRPTGVQSNRAVCGVGYQNQFIHRAETISLLEQRVDELAEEIARLASPEPGSTGPPSTSHDRPGADPIEPGNGS